MTERQKPENLAWVLPRPSKSKYVGGFPLHFEIKLYRELGIDVETDKILHPFGGKAEYGTRIDLNSDTEPDYIGDAHNLNMFEDETFDIVVLDPPYNQDYSERLYNTGHVKLKYKTYTAEAVRVCKTDGYVVMYHWNVTPAIKDTVLFKRIFLSTRINHKLRCVHIHRKDPSAWVKKGE